MYEIKYYFDEGEINLIYPYEKIIDDLEIRFDITLQELIDYYQVNDIYILNNQHIDQYIIDNDILDIYEDLIRERYYYEAYDIYVEFLMEKNNPYEFYGITYRSME